MNHQNLQNRIQLSLGCTVGFGTAKTNAPYADLFPSEIRAIKNAVSKRRHEFAAGRRAARQAMVSIGHKPVGITVNPDRSPAWPVDLIGSISHNAQKAIAIVLSSGNERIKGVGIDIECKSSVSADLITDICHPDEIDSPFLSGSLSERATRIFSAKESVFKAQYPVTKLWLNFLDVRILWTEADGTFSAISASPLADRLRHYNIRGGCWKCDQFTYSVCKIEVGDTQ